MIRIRLIPLLALGSVVAFAPRPAWSQAAPFVEKDSAAATQPAKAPTTTPVKLSEAERILRLEQSIEADTKELAELKQRLEDPKSEYSQAKDEFTRLDKRLKERAKELTSQPSEDEDIEGLGRARELAKERFDLAIQENEAAQAKYLALDKKIQLDREALAKLRTPGVPASQPATQPAGTPPAPVPQPAATGTPSAGGAAPAPSPSVGETTSPTPAETGATPKPLTVAPGFPVPQPAPGAGGPGEPAPAKPAVPVTKELIEAQQKAQAKDVQARQAEQEVQSISERIASLRENIETEQQLLETSRQKAANARATHQNLRDHIQKLISTGAPTEEVNKFWARVDDAEKRAADADRDVAEHVARLDELRAELDQLQSEQIAALQKADQQRSEAKAAEKQVQRLQNPWSFTNIRQWLLDHAPRIVGILIGMFLLLKLTRAVEGRMVKLIARGDGQGSPEEREARARTLASVFRNFAKTAVIAGGTLMLLSEISINIVPLLGGAAVIGLAVAFGAQSLIKDYFYGFMILLENQYAINDVIKIGDAAGLVERITLRMTVLRGIDGAVHFIPHGEIQRVTNLTHGWSRAVFDIGVGYGEDVDRVMEVLTDLGKRMRKEPRFARLILDDPEMLGVDSFGDSAVVIKFLVKTRPLQQWTVRREMLRRIKKRFDELGIEIPFPHRTVYVRNGSPAATDDEPDLSALPGDDTPGDRPDQVT